MGIGNASGTPLSSFVGMPGLVTGRSRERARRSRSCRSLKTGQWHWRDQLAASPPQRGLGLSFFFSFTLALYADEARHAGNASLAGLGGLRPLTLIEGLAEASAMSMMRLRIQNQLSRAVTGPGRDWPDKSPSVYRSPGGHRGVRGKKTATLELDRRPGDSPAGPLSGNPPIAH